METEKKYNRIGCVKRTGQEGADSIRLQHKELELIEKFSFYLNHQSNGTNKKRGYIIELYKYDGFGMIKFYPRSSKNNSKKYELRSHELGYSITFGMVRQILWQCANIMKEYLDENPSNFIGYVGQPDSYDDSGPNPRLKSQRSAIYDRYVSSLFRIPKYSLSSEELFGQFNLKLIRKARKKQELSLTDDQKRSYEMFQTFLKNNEEQLPAIMTRLSREQYLLKKTSGS